MSCFDKTTDGADSHLAKLQKLQQAIGYSQSIKPPNNGGKWLVITQQNTLAKPLMKQLVISLMKLLAIRLGYQTKDDSQGAGYKVTSCQVIGYRFTPCGVRQAHNSLNQ